MSVRLIAGVLVLVAACSGSDTAQLEQQIDDLEQQLAASLASNSTVAPASPTTSVAASDLAEEAAPGERTFIVTTSAGEGCTWERQSYEATDDPTIEILSGTLACRSRASDPRVSGVQRWHLTEPHYIYYSSSPNTGRFEATVVLTNENGTWRGEGFGGDLWDQQGELSTAYYVEFVGEGLYEGLIYREWGAKHPESNGYMTSGYIEPAD